MSYVPGINLQELIEESGALTPLQTVRIARQVALGLAAAHERGLIHRDIKPGNILIERNGQRAVLTDFGLAQAADDASLTHSRLLAGTPNFMSPEQANGIEIDARSDLFSLGSVMYSMLAGHPPFRAPNAYAVVKRLIEESPRPLSAVQPTTPEWLARLVMRLLEKDRNQRFASAVEVAELLVECEKHLEHPSLHPLPKGLAIKSTTLRFPIATGFFSHSGASYCYLRGTMFGGLTLNSPANSRLRRSSSSEARSRKYRIRSGTNRANQGMRVLRFAGQTKMRLGVRYMP